MYAALVGVLMVRSPSPSEKEIDPVRAPAEVGSLSTVKTILGAAYCACSALASPFPAMPAAILSSCRRLFLARDDSALLDIPKIVSQGGLGQRLYRALLLASSTLRTSAELARAVDNEDAWTREEVVLALKVSAVEVLVHSRGGPCAATGSIQEQRVRANLHAAPTGHGRASPVALHEHAYLTTLKFSGHW